MNDEITRELLEKVSLAIIAAAPTENTVRTCKAINEIWDIWPVPRPIECEIEKRVRIVSKDKWHIVLKDNFEVARFNVRVCDDSGTLAQTIRRHIITKLKNEETK